MMWLYFIIPDKHYLSFCCFYLKLLTFAHTFVEDEGWHKASERYYGIVNKYADKKIVLLELGVGGNTPAIIKYPFWRMTYANENATYICINYGEAICPDQIQERSICIDADIAEFLQSIKR